MIEVRYRLIRFNNYFLFRYTPKEDMVEASSLTVPDTYFEANEGNRVVLYQDAHTPQLPVVSAKKYITSFT